ncbi:MAG: polysaccharide deacetylase family protein [Methylocella sp.]
MNHFILRLVSDAAHKLRLDEIIGQRYKGAGSIIFGHSVVQSRTDAIDSNLQLSIGFLELLLRHYIANRIDIISLDEAFERLSTGNKRQFICFTFDDGYRDNLTSVLQLFKKYASPFAVYVTTAFLERRLDYWWAPLREVLRRHNEDIFIVGGRRFLTSTPQQKRRTFRTICRNIGNLKIDVKEINHFCRRKGVTEEQMLDRDALKPSELKVLSEDPLVEIGGHTETHRSLAQLTLDDARADILRNQRYLERLIGKEVRHFAYPYGDADSCGEREFALCRELGFRSAATTRLGGLFTEHLIHNTSLPRIRFFGGCESIGLIECQRNGAIAAIQSRLGSPIIMTAGEPVGTVAFRDRRAISRTVRRGDAH